MSLVKLENVSKQFMGITVLENVSIDIIDKEFVGIIGQSGAGKSTLLKIIAGLEKADSGCVYIGDRIVKEPSPEVAYMFQDYRLFPWLTVKENIIFPLRTLNLPKHRIASLYERVTYYMEILGLVEKLNAYPHELSGGLKQRVALCRALCTSPKVLLLDEPSSALDMFTAINSWHLLRKLFEEVRDTIFIIVSHNLDEIAFLCDRVIVLSNNPGRVIADINLKDLKSKLSCQDIDVNFIFSEEFLEIKRTIAYYLFKSGSSKSFKALNESDIDHMHETK
ncbi:ABC transporter related protein [Thermocrinis albus DSM 14484]|uniref:ABC transporter related protein n=1 Tax=Thermocrinis albus (strain DSM 14484 / JCM 11386 / HI 11/12) TaxID=638303 RepID=D3SQA7_THEAH|nr:ABC transporter ATP-binding protein [Thermocrinis albus]ADC89344.1 ABC transporter related protein [Thermocrinis albus DSM 14484]